MDTLEHWNTVFTKKHERQFSWFEELPAVSLRLLQSAGLKRDTCVVDVGGGDSHLVDHLLAEGLDCLAVLDVSSAALTRAKRRLGAAAATPTWIEADVVGAWALKPMDIWHDRAVFHFLTVPDDRAAYKRHLSATIRRGGSAIIATFAHDGPEQCSGLPVQRYSPMTLQAELGAEFELVESLAHRHTTAWGSVQPFQYSRFLRH